MVDYCLKLSLQPWIHTCFHREIMNSMKSVTIMMIDGVCFIRLCSFALGMGRVLGEGHHCDGCSVHVLWLTVPGSAVAFLKKKNKKTKQYSEKSFNLGTDALKKMLFTMNNLSGTWWGMHKTAADYYFFFVNFAVNEMSEIMNSAQHKFKEPTTT